MKNILKVLLASSVNNTDGTGYNDPASWQISTSSSKLQVLIKNDAGDAQASITSNSTISTGTWYYFVVTRTSGGNYKMYFNGEEEASGSDGDSGTDLDCTTLALGINRAYDTYWDGGIAIVQIYKGKALSAAEVKQNFDATKGRYV